MNNKLEVIAWSLDDAIDIYKSGADRIELVADLEKGGLSPSLNLVKQVIEKVNIPVRVMVRMTEESFVYNKEMMDKHLEYIHELKNISPEGIVFGSLTKEGKINFEQLELVIEAKEDMKLTFHRAFDELEKDLFMEEFEKLSTYDVDTLLTSGLCKSAFEGMGNIKKLIDKKTINILPGKSISIKNAKKIINETNANFIHIGYSARDVENVNGSISQEKIKKIIESINE